MFHNFTCGNRHMAQISRIIYRFTRMAIALVFGVLYISLQGYAFVEREHDMTGSFVQANVSYADDQYDYVSLQKPATRVQDSQVRRAQTREQQDFGSYEGKGMQRESDAVFMGEDMFAYDRVSGADDYMPHEFDIVSMRDEDLMTEGSVSYESTTLGNEGMFVRETGTDDLHAYAQSDAITNRNQAIRTAQDKRKKLIKEITSERRRTEKERRRSRKKKEQARALIEEQAREEKEKQNQQNRDRAAREQAEREKQELVGQEAREAKAEEIYQQRVKEIAAKYQDRKNIPPLPLDEQRVRALKAIYLRAESFYEMGKYVECLRALDGIFMFNPYDEKAQALKAKAEKKFSKHGLQAQSEGLFDKSLEADVLTIKKLYEAEQYRNAIDLCAYILSKDATNKDAMEYLLKCEKALAEEQARILMEQDTSPDVLSVYQTDAGVDGIIDDEQIPSPRTRDEAQELAMQSLLTDMVRGQMPTKDVMVSGVLPERESGEQRAPIAPYVSNAEVTTLLKDAQYAYRFNDYARAQTLYKAVLAVDPGNEPALKGIQEIQNARYAEEIAGYIVQINEMHNTRRYADASVLIQKGLALNPHHVELHTLLQKNKNFLDLEQRTNELVMEADAAERMGDTDKAQRIYKKILAYDFYNEKALTGLKGVKEKGVEQTIKGYIAEIEVCQRDRQYKVADKLLQKGLMLDPAHETLRQLMHDNVRLMQAEQKVEDLLNGAQYAYDAGNYADAKQKYQSVFLYDPDNQQAHRGARVVEEQLTEQKIQTYLADIASLQGQGMYNDAEIMLQEALSIAPDRVQLQELLQKNVGFMQREKKLEELFVAAEAAYDVADYDQALLLYKEILSYDDTHQRARAGMVKVYSAQAQQWQDAGKYNAAAQVFQQGLAVDPNNARVQNLIQENEISMRNAQEAERLLVEAQKAFDAMQYAQARQLYKDVLTYDAENQQAIDGEKVAMEKDIAFTLSSTIPEIRKLQDAKDYAAAGALLDKCLALDPEHAEVKELSAKNIARMTALQEAHVFLSQAKAAYDIEDYAQAQELYQKVLDLEFDNKEALEGLRVSRSKDVRNQIETNTEIIKKLQSAGKYTEAHVLIQKTLGFDSDNWTLKRLSRKNNKLMRKSEVDTITGDDGHQRSLLPFFSKPLNQNQAQTAELTRLAKKAYASHDYEVAISLYEEALEYDPENKKITASIDKAKEKLIVKGSDQYNAEVASFSDEIRKKVDFYASVAKNLQEKNKYGSAKVLIQKGLMLSPKDARLQALQKKNDDFFKKGVQRKLEEDKQDNAQEINRLVNKGVKEYLLGKYEEALESFGRVLELDPSDEKAKQTIQKIEEKVKTLNPAHV